MSHLLFLQKVDQNGSVVWHVTARGIHHYSRIVYFRSLLMSLAGETSPTIDDHELHALKSYVKTHELTPDTPKTRVGAVKIGIKVLGLPKRHIRHAVAIAEIVFGKSSKLLDLSADLMLRFSRFFRFLESTWSHTATRRSRCYFLNYSTVIHFMCKHCHVACVADGIKSPKLRRAAETALVELIREGQEKLPRNKRNFNVSDLLNPSN